MKKTHILNSSERVYILHSVLFCLAHEHAGQLLGVHQYRGPSHANLLYVVYGMVFNIYTLILLEVPIVNTKDIC
jgi:hypothetical protein